MSVEAAYAASRGIRVGGIESLCLLPRQRMQPKQRRGNARILLVRLAPREERPHRSTEDVPLSSTPPFAAARFGDEDFVPVGDAVRGAFLQDRHALERAGEEDGVLGGIAGGVDSLRSMG